MALYDDEDEESGDDESSEKLLSLAKTAFPDQEWDEARLDAFKELIEGCSGYMGPDEEEEDEKPKGDSKDGAGLALLFGEPKRKK